MAQFGRDEKKEIEGFDRRQRDKLKRLIYYRIVGPLQKSKGSDPLDQARLAKMAAEVLDKIASVDLKEAQRDEIVRKILTAGTQEPERIVVNIVYPDDPAKPPTGGDPPKDPTE